MEKVRIIEIKKSVFDDNGKEADELRAELKRKGVFLLNVMSSPGSGKTTTLVRNNLKSCQCLQAVRRRNGSGHRLRR